MKLIKAFCVTQSGGKQQQLQYWILWPEKWLSLSEELGTIDADVSRIIKTRKVDKQVAEAISYRLIRNVLFQQSVTKLEPFDVATTDHCGDCPGLFITSNKFYDFCRAWNADIDWEPFELSDK